MNQCLNSLICTMILIATSGCIIVGPRDDFVVHRRPWQMIDTTPAAQHEPAVVDVGALTEIDDDREAPPPPMLQRPLMPAVGDDKEPVGPEAIASARSEATQKPSDAAFINAVQLYDFQPGVIYEVMTAPGFVTVLRLRAGEQLLHLAAGDTSRWLVDAVEAGIADPDVTRDRDIIMGSNTAAGAARISVLIKPTRLDIQTNMLIATNERTYLLDLKSVDARAYHSVVAWTYPRRPTIANVAANASGHTSGKSTTRNYAYVIKTRKETTPPWTPVSVYDDGMRVHVVLPDDIDTTRRPPLFLVDRDGAVRLVNYHTTPDRYIVHELFDRAELRLGNERVIISRMRPAPTNPIARLIQAIRGEDQ